MKTVMIALCAVIGAVSAWNGGYAGQKGYLAQPAGYYPGNYGYAQATAPVPYVAKPRSKGYLVGGDRAASAAYNYKNGYDRSASNGARAYEHNAGYGWAAEGDSAAPNLSSWNRQYSAAQSSAYGANQPRLYQVAAPAYGGYAW